MNPDWLLKHFNQISEAPDAVPRLRRFILDLAVRGRLVEQDPSDEPAVKLLKKIETEKRRLLQAEVIRKPRPVVALANNDQLYDLPTSWAWTRLGMVGSIVGGGTPPSKDGSCFTEGGAGIAWLTPADLGGCNSLFVAHGARDLTERGLLNSSAQLMPKGSVLFTSRAPIGYTAIAANKISTNQGFKSIVPFILESNRYIAVYFKAFASWIDGKAPGTTFKEVSGKIVSNLPFPLPPLTEQHRIVAKVDELMTLCDELEAAQSKREKRRDRLVVSTLHGLNNGDAGAEADRGATFKESVCFYFNHLPRLTTRPEHIKQLRQTILNLAVRGKLVPQDPNDEAVSEWSNRINGENVKLTGKGGAKKENLWSPLSKGEMPFPIPASWRRVRVSDVADSRLGKMLDKAKNQGIPKRYLRNINVRWFGFDLSNLLEMKFEESELDEFSLKPGDVLICEGGEPGRAAIWFEHDSDIYFQKALHRVRFLSKVVPMYFVLALRHDTINGYLERFFTGVGIKHLTGRGLARYTFPLPPLAEQHRIVAKVDQLMALCDDLETRVTDTIATRRKLLEASLQEALSA